MIDQGSSQTTEFCHHTIDRMIIQSGPKLVLISSYIDNLKAIRTPSPMYISPAAPISPYAWLTSRSNCGSSKYLMIAVIKNVCANANPIIVILGGIVTKKSFHKQFQTVRRRLWGFEIQSVDVSGFIPESEPHILLSHDVVARSWSPSEHNA